MTWTKLGAEFPEYMAETGVSIPARYTHVELIAYLYRVESRTGLVPRGLLRRLVSVHDPEAVVAELVAAGLWQAVPEGWRIVHHGDVIQESLDAQEQKRERDREAQRRAREKRTQRREDEAAKLRGGRRVSARVTGGVSRGVSEGVSADVYTGSQTDRQTDKDSPREGSESGSVARSNLGTVTSRDPWEDVQVTPTPRRCPATGCDVVLKARRELEWGTCANHRDHGSPWTGAAVAVPLDLEADAVT